MNKDESVAEKIKIVLTKLLSEVSFFQKQFMLYSDILVESSRISKNLSSKMTEIVPSLKDEGFVQQDLYATAVLIWSTEIKNCFEKLMSWKTEIEQIAELLGVLKELQAQAFEESKQLEENLQVRLNKLLEERPEKVAIFMHDFMALQSRFFQSAARLTDPATRMNPKNSEKDQHEIERQNSGQFFDLPTFPSFRSQKSYEEIKSEPTDIPNNEALSQDIKSISTLQFALIDNNLENVIEGTEITLDQGNPGTFSIQINAKAITKTNNPCHLQVDFSFPKMKDPSAISVNGPVQIPANSQKSTSFVFNAKQDLRGVVPCQVFLSGDNVQNLEVCMFQFNVNVKEKDEDPFELFKTLSATANTKNNKRTSPIGLEIEPNVEQLIGKCLEKPKRVLRKSSPTATDPFNTIFNVDVFKKNMQKKSPVNVQTQFTKPPLQAFIGNAQEKTEIPQKNPLQQNPKVELQRRSSGLDLFRDFEPELITSTVKQKIPQTKSDVILEYNSPVNTSRNFINNMFGQKKEQTHVASSEIENLLNFSTLTTNDDDGFPTQSREKVSLKKSGFKTKSKGEGYKEADLKEVFQKYALNGVVNEQGFAAAWEHLMIREPCMSYWKSGGFKESEFKNLFHQRLRRQWLDAVKDSCDMWEFTRKQRKPLITLLTTMKHVLTYDTGRWKPPTVADMMNPRRVKKVFMETQKIVHPDACANLIYVDRAKAERVYQGLHDAYDIYKQELRNKR